MAYHKILTIQDISCVGQCSLTVALPILSAAGQETCILPSAVLSTHTAGFTGYTVRDLTEDIPAITAHWEKEKIAFEAVYTGYLGSTEQIGMVRDLIARLSAPGALAIVDPAMADNGRLYPAFDGAYVEAMKDLAFSADIILPNITEACFLTGTEYRETYDSAYVAELCRRVCALGAKVTVLTGVSYREGKTGVVVYGKDTMSYYEHEKISKGCHGTGDVYASAFAGAYLNGKSLSESARIAADYTLSCIKITQGDPDHWYGVKFERLLPELAEAIRNG